MKAIVNGRLILPDEDGDFRTAAGTLLYDETIAEIRLDAGLRPAEEARLEAVLDARGHFVSPGFLNVHLHGAVGFDTMDDDPGALRAIARHQATTGVTGWLPTTMTGDFPAIGRALERVRAAMGRESEGAAILGAHLEGPFISRERRGAQAAEHIVPPDFARVAAYADTIRLLTIAPETLPEGSDFLERCRAAGITVSFGHSDADYDTARRAILQYGVRHITHLFNGMAPFHHRAPGLAGAALDTTANCEIIADNVHLHPAAQRLIWRAKEGRHIILITDSIRATGLGDGDSELGGQRVHVAGAVATLADGTLAGSVLTMNRAIANFAANTGADLARVVACAAKVPAESLGIYGQYGSLSPGKRADITIFDDTVTIQATIVAGRIIFAREGAAVRGKQKGG